MATKNEPQLRFPEFKDEWQERKLGEMSDVRTGPFGSALHSHDYVSFGTPIITVEHLSDYGIFHNNLPLVSDIDKQRLSTYLLKIGDIVFSRVGSVDRSSIIKQAEDGWLFSGRLLRVRFKTGFPSFFNYCFQLEPTKQKVRNIAVGQTMPSINTEILKSIELSFPTLPEQTKIANFLTAVDEKIQALRKKKELTQQYKKGIMQRIFSQELRFTDENDNPFPDWEEKKLGEVADYEQPTNYLVSSTEYDDSFKTPVLTAGKTFILGYTNESNGIYNKNLPVIIFDDFTTATQFVNFPFKAKSSAMKIITARDGYNIKFIFEKLQTINYELGGHGRHWISVFAEMEISFPTLLEQTKIANFLSAIDERITLIDTQLKQAEAWKKGLLQKMFC